MLEAHPDFDPHNLKHEGENSAKSAHVNEPYVFQKFPEIVYKAESLETRTVKDQGELDKAIADGFSEDAPATPAVEPVHVEPAAQE